MSNKEYSPIKLQLEEAIWLDHRAKNAQIVSLELVPDVDIVEDDYFVNIRGHLVLTGKYETEEEEESLDLESSSLAEQLQFDPLSVEPKEIYEHEYRGRIEHRFPFDVTVPANKVSNVDEVYVHIEQFDYTISDGHRLQIKTEISITGIENVSEKEEKKTDSKIEVKQATEQLVDKKLEKQPESKVWSDFLPVRNQEVQEEGNDVRDEQQDNRQGVAHGSQSESNVESAVSKEELRKEVAEQSSNLQASAQPSSTEQTDDQQVRIEQASSDAGLEVKANQEDEQEEVLTEISENRVNEQVVPLFPQEIKTTFSSRREEDDAPVEEISAIRDQAKEEEEEAISEQRSKTVSFLTKLMEYGESGEEETQKKRLRICIIQQNETLEDISERYDISVYELMKANNLESDQISKGQILYIPKS